MIKPCHLLAAVVVFLFAIVDAHAGRHALLIGNDGYQAIPRLKNAASDAEAMGAALRKASYTVTVVKNRNLRQMKADLRQFKAGIKGGDEVVVFYSGHGVQMKDMNFLLPVDIEAESEAQVRDESLSLSKVLDDLREPKPAVVIAVIDACRDNPFRGLGRSIGGRGLTGVAGASGQMVIYSAGEGQKALDRLSHQDPVANGVFTRVFAKEIVKPGLTVDQIARNVRNEVNRLARSVNHDQVPAIYDQVVGDFYFMPPAAGATPPMRADRARAENASSLTADLDYWNSVKDSQDARDFENYLGRYPDGSFADLARTRAAAFGRAAAGRNAAPAAAASAAGRPVLPVTLSEEVWTAIEKSEAFAQAVPSGAVKVRYRQRIEFRDVSRESVIARTTGRIPGAAFAYSQITELNESRLPGMETDFGTKADTYLAFGLLPLGQVSAATGTTRLVRIHELTGSLFPLRQGARLKLGYETETAGMVHTASEKVTIICTLGTPAQASTIRPEWTGRAWPIDCAGHTVGAREGRIPIDSKNFYLEDQKVFGRALEITPSSIHGYFDVVVPKGGEYRWDKLFKGFSVSAYESEFLQQ